MQTECNLAAVDLGASGGRVMLARLRDSGLTLEEAHRFSNGPVQLADGLHWDISRLFDEIKVGLQKAGHMAPLSGVGIDTWGVDFALLDCDDRLIGSPFHYRDSRTDGTMEQVFGIVPRDEVFEHTGIQLMQINSLFQLFSMRKSTALESACTFLMIPDLLNFWLAGRKANEYTNATTTQFYNPHTHGYDLELLGRLGLPTTIFPEVVPPGTLLGSLLPDIAGEVGLTAIPVIAPACHDTGSAVAAIPTESPRVAYISSGTWSLVGVEAAEPVITSQSLAYNFTNEGGVGGRIRLLKNVAGLWLVQECRRVWASQGADYGWEELIALAESAPPFGPLVDPDHADFLKPIDMPVSIQAFCARTGQLVPGSHAEILRCVFESLAVKYRWVLTCLEDMLGYSLECIHVIGGGSQNGLLCQLTADAAGRPVIAGPVEATAIGNTLVQAMSLGMIGSLADGRQLVARSFPLKTYQPRSNDGWDDPFARFRQFV
jgi:rhamnulokinase